MMKELHFALYAIKKNIQSSAELRTSFLMNIVGMSINNTAFIILWGFFVKSVGVIGGWTVADIIGLQGFAALCFGIVFSAGAGIRKLAEYTASGAFDRFMLSPKNLLVRIATSSFGVSALGDIVFGIVCLGIYTFLIQATIQQILLIVLLVAISTMVFLSAAIVIYSTSFFFTDATSVTGSLFELFLTPSLFHGGAFQGAMRFIFTFAIPSLLIGALPVEIVRDISLGKLLLVSVLATFWFIVSINIFKRAVKRYESSNFMTFGN
ncbi:MAG: ABC-2 family transporter protein [Candidatus Moraniibacteriota bacterium]|nr:MAG: ABC-2 family transporter protein [Candidatus Moranbacteria bacterium]